MAVDLVKHENEMLRAWQDVVDDRTSTNWALFTYEGQSYALKFASKGDGGIGEVADELNSCKVMYAFCRVTDPKTGLPKYVLINWQGESTPSIRKGTCANHLRDVQKFFKGIHVTVNARTEEEVDEEDILEKVAKASGSTYNFNRSDSRNEDVQTGPVGTIYKRVDASKEIDAKARDSFWQKEEEEEKKRQLEEQKRKEEERKRRDDELKRRELEEGRAREHQILARMRSISEQRQAEEKASNRSAEDIERAKWNQQKQEDDNEEEERRLRSERLRRQRTNEAQSLIKQRSVDARAIFEQNTSAGQLSVSSRRSSSSNVSSPSPTPPSKVGARWPPSEQPASVSPTPTSPTSPIRQQSIPTSFTPNNHSSSPLVPSSSPLPNNKQNNEPSAIVPPAPEFADAPQPLALSMPSENEVTAVAPLSNGNDRDYDSPEQISTNHQTEEQPWEAPTQNDVNHHTAADDAEVQSDNVAENEAAGFGLRARALYDYQAGEPGEISFDPGDIITHVDQIDEGWWQGFGPDGTYGLFPANYVELLED